ncbi:MAG: hypothetical protein ACLFVO_17360 [Chloroflexaceae bacterium]
MSKTIGRNPQITMLGYTRVGKTSLLAAMHRWFEDTVEKSDLQLSPDYATVSILSDQLSRLEGLFEHIKVTEDKGIAPSQRQHTYNFGLGKRGEEPALTLHFQDYPGEYLKESPETRERVADLVRSSVVVLITIDAAALMEENGIWHTSINQPLVISALFQEAYLRLEGPRLVLFTPVKCETYVHDETRAEELKRRLKEKYQSLLALFASERLRNQVAVVITPVETLGEIVFSHVSHMRPEESPPLFFFRKIGPDAVYRPRNGDQPLRYILRFLLSRAYAERREGFGPLNPVWRSLRDLFGMDQHLREAVESFARGSKADREFEIVQGEELLTIDN